MENAIKNVKIMNGILSNYIAEMRGENYIRVGGFGPITPSPPTHTHTHAQKSVGGFGRITPPTPPPKPTQKSVAKPLVIAQFIQGLPCSAKL